MPSKTSKATVRAAQTAKEALALRLQGLTYDEIGQRLQVSHGTAYRHVSLELANTRKESAETAEELRQVELARLDRLLAVVGPMAESGDLAAVDRVLRIQERRAAYLGLDAPKAQLVAVDGRPDTVRALMALVSGGANSKLDADQAIAETVIDVKPEKQ